MTGLWGQNGQRDSQTASRLLVRVKRARLLPPPLPAALRLARHETIAEAAGDRPATTNTMNNEAEGFSCWTAGSWKTIRTRERRTAMIANFISEGSSPSGANCPMKASLSSFFMVHLKTRPSPRPAGVKARLARAGSARTSTRRPAPARGARPKAWCARGVLNRSGVAAVVHIFMVTAGEVHAVGWTGCVHARSRHILCFRAEPWTLLTSAAELSASSPFSRLSAYPNPSIKAGSLREHRRDLASDCSAPGSRARFRRLVRRGSRTDARASWLLPCSGPVADRRDRAADEIKRRFSQSPLVVA